MLFSLPARHVSVIGAEGRSSPGAPSTGGGSASASATSSSSGWSRSHRSASTDDRRGSYSRNAAGVRKRISLARQAWQHRKFIESINARTVCSALCAYGGHCFHALTTNDLIACHNESFGASLCWDEKKGMPMLDAEQTTRLTQARWRLIMTPIVTFQDGETHEAYTVANHRVCAECMRLAYGIPEHAWRKYLIVGRQGSRSLEMHSASVDLKRAERSDQHKDQRVGTSYGAALTWWLDWLEWFASTQFDFNACTADTNDMRTHYTRPHFAQGRLHAE